MVIINNSSWNFKTCFYKFQDSQQRLCLLPIYSWIDFLKNFQISLKMTILVSSLLYLGGKFACSIRLKDFDLLYFLVSYEFKNGTDYDRVHSIQINFILFSHSFLNHLSLHQISFKIFLLEKHFLNYYLGKMYLL